MAGRWQRQGGWQRSRAAEPDARTTATHPGVELELVGRVAHVGLNEVVLLDLPHPPEHPPQSTLFRSAACNGPVAREPVDAQIVQAVLFARAVAHAAAATAAVARASAGATYIVHEP
jgi:hypothetical protein